MGNDIHSGKLQWRRTVFTAPLERMHRENSHASSTPATDGSRIYVSYVPSPVFSGNHVYSILDNGIVYCLDAADGHIVWEKRIGGHHRASLVLVDGNLMATNDQGVTTVFRATPERYEQVAENDLGEFCYATPAVAGGRIYIRTENHLYCIAGRSDRHASAPMPERPSCE